jgi:hypothetical protein
MSNQRFTPEFKNEAIRQVIERGYSVAQVAGRIARGQRMRYPPPNYVSLPNLSPQKQINDTAKSARTVRAVPTTHGQDQRRHIVGFSVQGPFEPVSSPSAACRASSLCPHAGLPIRTDQPLKASTNPKKAPPRFRAGL